jgi:prolyl oligopeptidase
MMVDGRGAWGIVFAGSMAVIPALLASCAAPAVVETPRAAVLAPTPPPPPPPPPPQKAGPPAAVGRPVTETFFGQTVTDAYRYLEDVNAPEVQAFMRGQGEFARNTLDAIPGRAGMLARISELSEASVDISAVQVTGSGANPQVFYLKQGKGDGTRKLVMRNGFGGAEQLLFDPAAAPATGKRITIDAYLASPDGRHVAIGVAAGGSENTSLIVLEVSSARPIGEAIDRIGFFAGTHWAPDGKAFFYNRLPPPALGAATNRYLRSTAYRHVLGRGSDKDEAVLGPGHGASLADIDIPSVAMSEDGKQLVGKVEHGDLREISLYVAAVGDFRQVPEWKRVIEPKDDVTAYAMHDRALYLLTHHNAPRYKVVRTSLARPEFDKATTIIPHGDTVVREMAVAQDGLYIRELIGGVDRLQRLNFSQSVFSGGKLEFVRLPFDLAIRQMIASPKRPGALLRLEGWTESPRYVNIEERSGNLIDSGLLPKSTVNFDAIDEVRLMATAKDGTRVPVSLIYKKGTKLDTVRPTLLRAYGAYGITQAPTFSPASLAWLERGGVIGTCHVRGGGEFGEAWHRAGQKLTKPNTWRDLIACAEFMIERGFTRKSKLAIQGGSAGGITIGRAITERPDLFAAAVPAVGLLDTLRAEFTPNGPPNIPEFGSVKSEDGFNGLLAMSSLHAVKDGVNYPAVLLMHGVNDPRVEVWQSAKMAARLQAATAKLPDGRPVLLRLDYDAGHGVGSSRRQRDVELADMYSFLLWQFGEAEFQPK